jgi:hypothetical protein
MLSDLSWRVGARKSWHKLIFAKPSPMALSTFGANYNRCMAESLLRKMRLRERTFKYGRKSNRRISIGRCLAQSSHGSSDAGVIRLVCRADVTKAFCLTEEQDQSAQRSASETPVSTSRPALDSQEMPVASNRRSTAKPRTPSPAGPGRRRGARPRKFEQTKEAMRNDVQGGRLSVAQLENMLEKDLEARYGVSRDTARKARVAVLSELNSQQIPTNDK